MTREEAQLWALLADLNEDIDPCAHACRLRLSLATRCCPELQCPWDDAEQLLLYVMTGLQLMSDECLPTWEDAEQLFQYPDDLIAWDEP
jgi:hypothetical protein